MCESDAIPIKIDHVNGSEKIVKNFMYLTLLKKSSFHDCNFYIFMWHPSLYNAFL